MSKIKAERVRLLRFMEQHKLTADQCQQIASLADLVFHANTKAANGDPHRQSKDRCDKSENAALWQGAADGYLADLAELAATVGFTVDASNPRPCLIDMDGRYIEIP